MSDRYELTTSHDDPLLEVKVTGPLSVIGAALHEMTKYPNTDLRGLAKLEVKRI